MVSAVLVILGVAAAVGLAFVHARARRHPRLLALQIYFDILVGLLVGVASWRPGMFERWMQEDGWAEWATVVAFGLAAVRYGLRAVRWRVPPEVGGWLPRLGVLAVAGFCAFVAGEEISWGQRLFAFQPPELFLQANFQQELNVHNLLTGKTVAGLRLDSRFLVALIAIVFGAVVPALRRWAPVRALGPTFEAVAPPWELAPWFVGIAVVELAYPADLAGEACELVLGLLFVAAALVRDEPGVLDAQAPWSRRRVVAMLAGPLLLGLVTQPVVARLLYGPDEELVAEARGELRTLRGDLLAEGVIRPKLKKKQRVHKRLFTAAQSGYFDLSGGLTYLDGGLSPATRGAVDPRRDRRGYFVDPWNNPYWIFYARKGRRGLLYSFGPNRRRDTRLPKKGVPAGFEAGGDDIVVPFRIPKPAAE